MVWMKPRVPAGRAGGGGRLCSQHGAAQGPGSQRHHERPSPSSPLCPGHCLWRQHCLGAVRPSHEHPGPCGARGRTGTSTLPGQTLHTPRVPQNCPLCLVRAVGAAGGLTMVLCCRQHGAGRSLHPHRSVSPAEPWPSLLPCAGLCAPSTPSPPSVCPLHPPCMGKRWGLKPASVLCGINKSPKIRHKVGWGSGLGLLRAEDAGWLPRPAAEPSSSSSCTAGAREWICPCSCRSLLISPPKQRNVSLLCQI